MMVQGRLTKIVFPLMIILILFPACFYGFDFTDLSYHISNQLQANKIGITQLKFNPYWGGTDIIGGIWIKLFGSNLWTIRTAVVFIYALTFIVLSQAIRASHLISLMIIILFSSSPMPSGMILLADYYTLPMLFITCWAVVWYTLNQKPDSLLLLTLLIIITSICTFLRLPLIIIFSFPLLIFLLEKSASRIFKWIGICIACLILVYFSGVIDVLYQGIEQQGDFLEKTSGLHTFLDPFFRHLKENMFFFLEILFLIFLVHKTTKKSFVNCILPIYILIFTLAILDAVDLLNNISFLKGIAHSCFKRGLNSLHLLILFFIFKGIYRDRRKLYFAPIALMPFLLNFGTNTGISKMNYLLPCSFFCLVMMYEFIIERKYLATLFFLAILWNYKTFYRDGNFFEMKHSSTMTERLEHVRTSKKTSERVAWVSSTIANHHLSGQTILNYPSLPGINYLSRSPLYLGYPWSHFLKENVLFSAIKKDCSTGELKAAFIDETFIDSAKVIKYILENCPVSLSEKKETILFISFQS